MLKNQSVLDCVPKDAVFVQKSRAVVAAVFHER